MTEVVSYKSEVEIIFVCNIHKSYFEQCILSIKLLSLFYSALALSLHIFQKFAPNVSDEKLLECTELNPGVHHGVITSNACYLSFRTYAHHIYLHFINIRTRANIVLDRQVLKGTHGTCDLRSKCFNDV